METEDYYLSIVRMLKGQTPELEQFQDRLDWGGSGAVLEMYNETSGEDRDNFIRAMGQIIERADEPPSVIAQIVHIASSLNITQVEPKVRHLASRGDKISQEPIRTAVRNFLTYRNLRAHGHRKIV